VWVADKAALAAIVVTARATSKNKNKRKTAEMFAKDNAVAVLKKLDPHPDDSVAMPALADLKIWANETNGRFMLTNAVYIDALKVLGLTAAAVLQPPQTNAPLNPQSAGVANIPPGGAAAAGAPTMPVIAPPALPPGRIKLDADGIAAVRALRAASTQPAATSADAIRAKRVARDILFDFNPGTDDTIVLIDQGKINAIRGLARNMGTSDPVTLGVCVDAMCALGLDVDGNKLAAHPIVTATVLPQQLVAPAPFQQQPMVVVTAPALHQPVATNAVVAAPALLQQPAVAPNPALVANPPAAPRVDPNRELVFSADALNKLIAVGASAPAEYPKAVAKNRANALLTALAYKNGSVSRPVPKVISEWSVEARSSANLYLADVYTNALLVLGLDKDGNPLGMQKSAGAAGAPVVAKPRIVLPPTRIAAFEHIKSNADAPLIAGASGQWPEMVKNAATALVSQFDYDVTDSTIREPTQAEIAALTAALNAPVIHSYLTELYMRALEVLGQTGAKDALAVKAPASPPKQQTGVAATLASITNNIIGFFGGSAAAAPVVSPEKQKAAAYLFALVKPYQDDRDEVILNIPHYSSLDAVTTDQQCVDAIAHIDDLDSFIVEVIVVSMLRARGRDALADIAAEWMDSTPPVCRQREYDALRADIPGLVAHHIPDWDPTGVTLVRMLSLLSNDAFPPPCLVEANSYASFVSPLCAYLEETEMRDELKRTYMSGRHRIEREFKHACDNADDEVSMLMMLQPKSRETFVSAIKKGLLNNRRSQPDRNAITKLWRLMTAVPRVACFELVQQIPAVLNVKITREMIDKNVDDAFAHMLAFIPTNVYTALCAEIKTAHTAHEQSGTLRRDIQDSVRTVFDVYPNKAWNFVRDNIGDAVASANRELADPARRRFPPGVEAVLKQVPNDDVSPLFAQEILARVGGPWYQQYLNFMVKFVFNARDSKTKQQLVDLSAKLLVYCSYAELSALVHEHALMWLDDSPNVTPTHITAAVSRMPQRARTDYENLVTIRDIEASELIATIQPGTGIPLSVAAALIDEYTKKINHAYKITTPGVVDTELRMLWVRVLDAPARAAFIGKMVEYLHNARGGAIAAAMPALLQKHADLGVFRNELTKHVSVAFRAHVEELTAKDATECITGLLCVVSHPVFVFHTGVST
jgi:hypothetical protein